MHPGVSVTHPDGEVHVQGAAGFGCKMITCTPRTLDRLREMGARVLPTRGEGVPLSGQTLFQVEDSITWRMTVKRVAESLGMSYVSDVGTPGWLAIARSCRPAVAVFDLELPKPLGSGIDLARRFGDLDPACARVICSSLDEVYDLAEEVGAVGFQKGDDLAKLSGAIARAVRTGVVEARIDADDLQLIRNGSELDGFRVVSEELARAKA